MNGAAESRFEPGLVSELDEPVRRYFTHALRAGAPLAPPVRLTMEGRIKAGAWMPFEAEWQGDGRSFEWRARVGRPFRLLLSSTTTRTAMAPWMFGSSARSPWFTRAASTRRARPPGARPSRPRSGRPRACSHRGESSGTRRAASTSSLRGRCPGATRSPRQDQSRRGRPQRLRDALGRRQPRAPRLHPVRRRGAGGAPLRRPGPGKRPHSRLVVRHPPLGAVLQSTSTRRSGE